MKTIEDLDRGTIRRIDWQELFPGTLFFRALTLAFRVGPIAAGTFLILLLMALTGRSPATGDFSVLLFKSLACPFSCRALPVTIGLVVFCLTALFLWLFLARRGAVRLVTTERVPLGKGLRFALCRYSSLAGAVAIPLLGLVAALTLVSMAEKTFWFFTHGTPVLLGIAWFSVLIGVGLLLAFPMLPAAVAVDKCDAFDAFSRVFAYVFQRPFHTLFYIALASLFGAAGFFILKGSVIVLIWVVKVFNLSGLSADVMISGNLWSLAWWAAAVMLPYGFLFGYVCYAGVALYLILRRNLDGVAFDVIETGSAEPMRRLRPILQESEGVPDFALKPAGEKTEEAADSAQNEEPEERA